jgi:hypothetical protein
MESWADEHSVLVHGRAALYSIQALVPRNIAYIGAGLNCKFVSEHHQFSDAKGSSSRLEL